MRISDWSSDVCSSDLCAIYAATLGPVQPDAWVIFPNSFAAFFNELFTTPAGWAMIIVGNLVGLAFALVVLAISVVSFPMVVDGRAEAYEAVRTSVRVTMRNPGTVLLWGMIVALLLFIGCALAFVGLAVVLPVLGYATWHLYTRAVER